MIERLAVCGLGKLGSCIATVFALSGKNVTGYDLDGKKVSSINDRIAPIEEPGLQFSLDKIPCEHLRATIDVDIAVAGTQACVFVTQTPSHGGGNFDNSFLLDGIGKVARAVYHAKLPSYVFIVASTVTPGTCEREILPLLRLILGELHGRFSLIYKPEFIALGSIMQDLQNPDFHLIGGHHGEGIEEANELYECVAEFSDIRNMSLLEAELTKISLNCFVTMKISFANQVGMIAERLGADPQVILEAVGQDSRIGPKALKPGLPFGGPCFPRDNRMFKNVASRVGVAAHLSSATDWTNAQVLSHILSRIPRTGDVGILGQAYKPGTPVTEESPGGKLKDALVEQGRIVKTHDYLAEHSHELAEVLACLTVVVMTPWPQYRDLELPGHLLIPGSLIDPMKVISRKRP